ncbi:p40 [Phellodendron-associated higre-like virus]|uniref:P40 n=1 Tax=Phellodendron-associated higre-like virus TaxID=3022218 RepID=A0AAT9T5L5_9VIRU
MDKRAVFSVSADSWSVQEGLSCYSDLLSDLYDFDDVDSIDHLVSCLESESDAYAGCYARMIKRMNTLKFVGCNIPMVFVNGVPGGGKTKFVKDHVSSSESVVVVPFKGLRDDYRAAGYTALTQYSAVSALRRGPDTLVFDEFTCICKHVFLSCITIVEPKLLVVVGDVNQCWLRDGEGESLETLLSVYSPSLVLNDCYRCPCPDVRLLGKLCDYDIRPAKCSSESDCSCVSYQFVQLSDDADFETDGVSLCFSRSAQKHLESLGVSAATVRSYMGKQSDKICLFVLDNGDDFRVIKSRALRIVGLSRHVSRLYIYSNLSEADVMGLLGNASDEMHRLDLVTDEECEDFIQKFYQNLL